MPVPDPGWAASLCPYCGVGCGLLVRVEDGTVRRVKGDPDHPANFGDICAKAVHLPPTLTRGRLLFPEVRGRRDAERERVPWELVDRAQRRGRVVRLKGGDPAVFARLAEEIDAVRAAGIPFEIIPGVTAATAAAARAGISLTERGLASMLLLASATDHTGRASGSVDWGLLARAEGTLAFYMGVRALETVTASLTTLGRDPREPAILVERVGTPGERIIAGRLGEIAVAARAAGAESPAVLITGPTVAAASAPLSVRRVRAATPAPAGPVAVEA